MSAKAAPCLILLLCAGAAAEPAPPATVPAALSERYAAPLMPKLTSEVIREAVRETLAEAPENPRRYEADTIRGNSYTEFSEQFHEARVPGCLRPDGLKRQSTFIFDGLLALPFVAVAKLRGKCN